MKRIIIQPVPEYTPLQFSVFRIVFGVYLLIHFVHLIPFAPEIWSDQGALADARLNFTYGKFPNVLLLMDSPTGATVFVAVLSLLALTFTLGVCRRTTALLLWFGWACLFHRNNLIANPGIPMVGWLLLACSLIPTGEPLSLVKSKQSAPWQMPPILYWGAWWITAMAYTISGLDKLRAPSWQDGSALLHLLHNPLARDGFLRDWLLALPDVYLQLSTWAALILEIAFGILCVFKQTRALAWFLIMGMHIGILNIIDFADLTFGVMMIHLFTFNLNWIRRR